MQILSLWRTKDFMEAGTSFRGNSLKVCTRSWGGEIPDDLEIIQLGKQESQTTQE